MGIKIRISFSLLFVAAVVVSVFIFKADPPKKPAIENTTAISLSKSSVHTEDNKNKSANQEPKNNRAHASIKTITTKTHESSVAENKVDNRPSDHNVFPKEFEEALVATHTFSDKSANKQKYMSFNSNIFEQLKEVRVGDEVEIELVDGLFVNGIMKNVKTYENSPGVLKGVVELADQNAKMHFFTSENSASARILFNEKSKALVYEQRDGGSMLIETKISELFCSDDDMIYPLTHPSNS